MLKPHELKILRSKLVASAEMNLKEFIVENKVVLSQYAEATIQGLKERDRDKVKEMSYRLISVAKDFGREDISNMAKIIYRSMVNQTIFDNEDVFMKFEDSLTELSNIKTTNAETKRWEEEEEQRKRRQEEEEQQERRQEEELRKRRQEEEQRKRNAKEEQRKRRNYNSTSNDPWQVLGVNRNDNMGVIVKAYKNKVKKFHPDVMQSKDLPDEIVKFIEEKFREVTEAYEAIRRHQDTVRRRRV